MKVGLDHNSGLQGRRGDGCRAVTDVREQARTRNSTHTRSSQLIRISS
jgi:hypothetical protein